MPPRVEYYLTEDGKELWEAILPLPEWTLKWERPPPAQSAGAAQEGSRTPPLTLPAPGSHPFISLPDNQRTMSTRLKQAIRTLCSNLEIPLVGFAPVDRYDHPPFTPWVPEEFRPDAIFPGTKTVIVIGIPVSLPALETSPSIWYFEEYKTVNALLDAGTHRIASFLNEKGFASVAIPRDGYGSVSILKEKPVAFFSHRHAAFLAGLGNFGINNVILTRKFGPRVRFASVFTTAKIPPDPVMEEPLCIECMQCVKICPVNALPGRDYPEALTDKRACATRSEELAGRYISPCGFCIKVCPIGEDRTLFDREKTGIYDEADPRHEKIHRAWAHVRKYGGR